MSSGFERADKKGGGARDRGGAVRLGAAYGPTLSNRCASLAASNIRDMRACSGRLGTNSETKGRETARLTVDLARLRDALDVLLASAHRESDDHPNLALLGDGSRAIRELGRA
jgi:hypothetical protein